MGNKRSGMLCEMIRVLIADSYLTNYDEYLLAISGKRVRSEIFTMYIGLYTISMLRILMSSSGFSLYTLVFSILWITSRPWIALPKIVCLLSSHGCTMMLESYSLKCDNIEKLTVFSVVIKNWLPFVFGPALAILTVYGLSCFSVLNSSSNSLPQMLSPPVPSPSGSPH